MQQAPRSVESLEFTLHCQKRCVCHYCGVAEVDLPSPDRRPWNGDLTSWAHAMAEILRTLGWSAPDWDKLRCVRCNGRAIGQEPYRRRAT